MSTAEFIEKMPELPVEEIDLIWDTASRLRGGWAPEITPELTAALDEAEASLATEGGVPIEDVMRRFGLCPGE